MWTSVYEDIEILDLLVENANEGDLKAILRLELRPTEDLKRPPHYNFVFEYEDIECDLVYACEKE